MEVQKQTAGGLGLWATVFPPPFCFNTDEGRTGGQVHLGLGQDTPSAWQADLVSPYKCFLTPLASFLPSSA